MAGSSNNHKPPVTGGEVVHKGYSHLVLCGKQFYYLADDDGRFITTRLKASAKDLPAKE